MNHFCIEATYTYYNYAAKKLHFFQIKSLPEQTTFTCISNIDNTPATKKRQAITGVRQKASTAHSSITKTLMD
jgi:hypothetical protein